MALWWKTKYHVPIRSTLDSELEAVKYLLQSFTEPSENHPVNLINSLTPEGHSGADVT